MSVTGGIGGLIVGLAFLGALRLSAGSYGLWILLDDDWGGSISLRWSNPAVWLSPIGAVGACALLLMAEEIARRFERPRARAGCLAAVLLAEVLVVALPLTWAVAMWKTGEPIKAWRVLFEVLGVAGDYPDKAAGLFLVGLYPFWFLGITRIGAVPFGAGKPWPWGWQLLASAAGGFAAWLYFVGLVSANTYRMERLILPMLSVPMATVLGLIVGGRFEQAATTRLGWVDAEDLSD